MNEEKERANETMQYINFLLAGEEYGVPILQVREIIRHRTLTKIPQSAAFIEGVLNLRGQVIPVFDLRSRFGLPCGERDSGTRIVVVKIEGQVLGFIVDAVTEVLSIPGDSIDPPPPVGAGIDQEFIFGMAKMEDRLIILLDLDRIFSQGEQETVAEIASQ